MPSIDRRGLAVTEVGLAAATLLVVALELLALEPYPPWPTVGPVPVNPVLVVPGLLGLAAVAGSIHDGLGIAAVLVAILGGLTTAIAALGLYSLYTETAGGVFWVGLLVIVVGVPLAVVVLVRTAVHRYAPALPAQLRERVPGIARRRTDRQDSTSTSNFERQR